MVNLHFTPSCTVAASFCLHIGVIFLSQDTELVLCVHVHDVLYIKNFKIFHTYCFYFFNSGMGITFYYHFNPVLVYTMVSFLSLFRVLMHLCT
jgi:hypothetical protein